MNTTAPQILLVDDDRTLCELLQKYLSKEGYNVNFVSHGEAALFELKRTDRVYDAVVLDIMMPGMSGIEVLQRLRSTNTIPVIMLTGKGDDIDRILGLEMGADDYLGKPCNPRELLARIRAILRRTKQPPPSTETTEQVISLHNIRLDMGTLSTHIKDCSVDLTNAEFNVLFLLMKSAGRTLSKETLTEQVLHRKLEAHDRSIDVHISRLRQKLAKHGIDRIIKSIRGAGYQMLTEADNNE